MRNDPILPCKLQSLVFLLMPLYNESNLVKLFPWS
uniref:Uncharacterized protein n=1 Tax=Arundo donax TaxID=35708 RepID=A0A0A9D8W7_ARUDO